MKHKRRSAKFARFTQNPRFFCSSRSRKVRRLGAARRFAAIAPIEVPVPDPVRFYAVPRVPVNGTIQRARKTSRFPLETGTSRRLFRAKWRFEASFSRDSISQECRSLRRGRAGRGPGGDVKISRIRCVRRRNAQYYSYIADDHVIHRGHPHSSAVQRMAITTRRSSPSPML